MTTFPWKPVGALLADWALTNLDAAHAPTMGATERLMANFVPAAVTFAANAVPRTGFFANLTAGIETNDVQQVGENVLAAWPPAFDAMWDFVITAARASADSLFGPPPALS